MSDKTCVWSGHCVPHHEYSKAYYADQKIACPGCKKMVKLRKPLQGGITYLQIPRHNRLEEQGK